MTTYTETASSTSPASDDRVRRAARSANRERRLERGERHAPPAAAPKPRRRRHRRCRASRRGACRARWPPPREPTIDQRPTPRPPQPGTGRWCSLDAAASRPSPPQRPSAPATPEEPGPRLISGVSTYTRTAAPPATRYPPATTDRRRPADDAVGQRCGEMEAASGHQRQRRRHGRRRRVPTPCKRRPTATAPLRREVAMPATITGSHAWWPAGGDRHRAERPRRGSTGADPGVAAVPAAAAPSRPPTTVTTTEQDRDAIGRRGP